MKSNLKLLTLALSVVLFTACSVKKESIVTNESTMEKAKVEKNENMTKDNLKKEFLDMDKDGISDAMDKCPMTMDGVVVDNDGCEMIDMDRKIVVHFDFDKSDIKYDDKIEINSYVSYLKKFPTAKIVIEGHTDSMGSLEYNDKLGIRRALKVRDEIVSQDINKNRIKLEYYGETMPVFDNKTSEHRAQNRRSVSRIIR
jgi:OOP family OmpA-OmpF porin